MNFYNFTQQKYYSQLLLKMKFSKGFLEEIIAFRKQLHQSPELSGKEHKTTLKIREFIIRSHPDEIITFREKTWLAAVFNGKKAGKTLVLRADIDALPIAEKNSFWHKSKSSGVSHKCGHDGHTAIFAGLLLLLFENPPAKGMVVKLFGETSHAAYPESGLNPALVMTEIIQ